MPSSCKLLRKKVKINTCFWIQFNVCDGHVLFRWELCQRQLMECVISHFGYDLIKYSWNRITSLLVLKGHESNLLRIVSNTLSNVSPKIPMSRSGAKHNLHECWRIFNCRYLYSICGITQFHGISRDCYILNIISEINFKYIISHSKTIYVYPSAPQFKLWASQTVFYPWNVTTTASFQTR